jgi:hypothetical protein
MTKLVNQGVKDYKINLIVTYHLIQQKLDQRY